MQVTRTQAIKSFLESFAHKDLAALYDYNMECQVNVAQDNGERVEDDYKGRQWHGWTDGIQTWKSFRIPYNASTTPSYDDRPMSFDLVAHVEGIGMTGWDWVNRVSRWVAFDFDAIVGHSDKHSSKLDPEQLTRVQNLAMEIPWVTIRRSTSGNGLHLYVFLNAVPTANHKEHAALARAVLGKMSAITSHDFFTNVDICGGNMWCWHRKMKGTNGLEIIKQGSVLTDIPINWQDHVPVVSGKRKKVLPKFIEESNMTEAEKTFAMLTGQRNAIMLDEGHKKLISYLEETNAQFWWDQDNGMLVAHTFDLKQAHTDLAFRGLFETESKGTEHGHDHNCFMFPIRDGGWVVRRFTPGVKEHPSWEQDGHGWTRCYYNRDPSFNVACRTYGGIECEKGGFIFTDAELAAKAANDLGVNLNLPSWALSGRKCKLKKHKDGRVIVELDFQDNDNRPDMEGFLIEKKHWKKIFDTPNNEPNEMDVGNYDDVVRHIVTTNRDDAGWVIQTEGRWGLERLEHVREVLSSMGLHPQEIKGVLGKSIRNPWELVTLPFQPEYPGGRRWNRNAPQLRYAPNLTSDTLHYPTWERMLKHCGQNLDDSVAKHPWAIKNGIKTGADYLKCWIASLFQFPTQPLPYLFFWGPQNSGKSIFHEALELLITRGCVRADRSLENKEGFNGELLNSVLCILEETELKQGTTAYNRIKDWVTSRMLPVHVKKLTPFDVVNTTHWVHCANTPNACPIFQDDTRITMIHVPPLDQIIPKQTMIGMLEKEASDFLGSVLKLELPETPDRLNIPIIVTEEKLTASMANRTILEIFIADCCHEAPGYFIQFSEFFERFGKYAGPEGMNWTKYKVSQNIPSQFPQGRNRKNNQKCVCNISWEDEMIKRDPIVISEGRFMPGG